MTTELVTNACVHGRHPLQIRLSRTATPCRVRLEADDGFLDRPDVAEIVRDRPGGRGMRVVDEFAGAWGVFEHPAGGKTAWAEVSCTGSGAIPCAGVTRTGS
ncbi:ATP-binding protein [Amycolatopsis sp. lyj-23]|uniref:ATP-binding protein n=1 Tax=Amycolatopsis sp. lyj-23 TaxID=2789283 RepID=UPI00397B131D